MVQKVIFFSCVASFVVRHLHTPTKTLPRKVCKTVQVDIHLLLLGVNLFVVDICLPLRLDLAKTYFQDNLCSKKKCLISRRLCWLVRTQVSSSLFVITTREMNGGIDLLMFEGVRRNTLLMTFRICFCFRWMIIFCIE